MLAVLRRLLICWPLFRVRPYGWLVCLPSRIRITPELPKLICLASKWSSKIWRKSKNCIFTTKKGSRLKRWRKAKWLSKTSGLGHNRNQIWITKIGISKYLVYLTVLLCSISLITFKHILLSHHNLCILIKQT